jgi:hypothetical protein
MSEGRNRRGETPTKNTKAKASKYSLAKKAFASDKKLEDSR